MYIFTLLLLLYSSLFAQDLTEQLQNDLEDFSEQMGSYQDSKQATEWQENYENKELLKLKEKYRKRKVKIACGTCPLNKFVRGVLIQRLNYLYQQKHITKKKWELLLKGLYYFSFDQKKQISSYHSYMDYMDQKTVNFYVIDEHVLETLEKQTDDILVYTYKTHELYVEIVYNYSEYPLFRIYQIDDELLDSLALTFKKYNFQDPELNIPTELSFQKFIDYNGKFLSFYSDVKVGTGEYLTELDYQLHDFAKGELVFSGTNDNTQNTIRHNLQTGASSKVSVYLKTYFLNRMTPEQRSKMILVDGGKDHQNYWGFEWQWVFDSN